MTLLGCFQNGYISTIYMIIYQLWLVNLKPVKPVCVCFGQTFGWMLLCSIVLEELNAVPLL